jgi:hypothetical protein
MKLFPRARLAVPREVLPHCSPPFLAKTLRAFAHAQPLELSVGRSKVCYPGPIAVSALADSPDIAVRVVCRLGRAASTKVPLAHLRSTLARLLAAGKIASLSLADRCSIAELEEIVRVFRGNPNSLAGDSIAALEIDDPALEPSRERVRGLHITQNPGLLGQRKGAQYFARLISMLPNLESVVIDHSGGPHFTLLAEAIASRRRMTSLTLDGTLLERHDPAFLPQTLVTLSLRGVSVSAPNFPSLVTNICALEGIASCSLSGALRGYPDDACIYAIKGLINKPTLRNLDLSRNSLFTNDYPRDENLARAMLASPTLESLSVKAVCTPAHVVVQLIRAIPATRLSRFTISVGVYTTVISENDVKLLSQKAPPSCAIVFGKRIP